ncbi:hypothetical protein B0T14DRAFT_603887 [Immersiella caudata]|uniref:Uncharacterized protein n=1 Tax=Immersiella caudata TaxID=314043 RepID=A0AA39WRR0_9PEZI|nr:hypothetical protein B0T14DRAFT_603887 [Immersiella caudata]
MSLFPSDHGSDHSRDPSRNPTPQPPAPPPPPGPRKRPAYKDDWEDEDFYVEPEPESEEESAAEEAAPAKPTFPAFLRGNSKPFSPTVTITPPATPKPPSDNMQMESTQSMADESPSNVRISEPTLAGSQQQGALPEQLADWRTKEMREWTLTKSPLAPGEGGYWLANSGSEGTSGMIGLWTQGPVMPRRLRSSRGVIGYTLLHMGTGVTLLGSVLF